MLKETDIQKTLSAFKPENLVFLISIDKNNNNKPSGMIVAWKTRISGNPPLYALALGKSSHTYKLIKKSEEFVIAVPNKDLRKAIEVFGYQHGNEVDKFKKTGLETIPSKHLKTPLIKDATICYECKLVNIIKTGSCNLVIGEVIATHHNKNKKVLLVIGKDKDDNRIYNEF
jgi:flavin reductase (DIM6/NTAB) family NADH-FMN oxidoreductase RutF